ncbi:MAG: ABC-F family ATP-binding cassette domain-containing protein [Bacteroidaceae bacterium]|nr:ABC-F family ATP-binding cassette domain-containing protein [Bacteroidaceae bacterium]
MITVDGLTVEFGGTTLFKDISFQINEKDRIALMGKNGAGKSTLLKILAGVRGATRGTVSAPKDTVIAYLPQHLMTEDGRTVFEETCQAFAHLHETEAEINRINEELTVRTDYESDEYMALIEKVSALSEKFYAIDMTHFEEDVEKTLLGLGFKREEFNRPTSEFSGGWRMRIELAKLLLKNPDVLLLDEPTNHLDIESIGWLEDFIRESSKAVVVISHDRKFVDNITTRTIEVTMGRIYDYKATYSHYLELRKERRAQQQKQYEEQQKMIQETKDFIERFKGTYSKTLQVQSRVKMLEKLELIEVDEEDTSALRLKFPPSPRSGSYPVMMSDVAKSFENPDTGKVKQIFSGVNLTVERGDKIAFVGRNGEGKSTLVKCIMQQLEHKGKLELGHNVQIGYFAQNQASLLDGELTVFQTIDDIAKGEIRLKIRDLLGAFMFGGEESTKKVKVLSGGERTRLAILKLLLEPVNLLILDEPTNHLDLKTKDVLKQALQDFDGTLIVVSHDRDFLDGLVTKVYEFGGGKVREHLCSIYEFLETKKQEELLRLGIAR